MILLYQVDVWFQAICVQLVYLLIGYRSGKLHVVTNTVSQPSPSPAASQVPALAWEFLPPVSLCNASVGFPRSRIFKRANPLLLAMISCGDPGNFSRWQTARSRKEKPCFPLFRTGPRSCIGLTDQMLDEEFITPGLNTEHFICTYCWVLSCSYLLVVLQSTTGSGEQASYALC